MDQLSKLEIIILTLKDMLKAGTITEEEFNEFNIYIQDLRLKALDQ